MRKRYAAKQQSVRLVFKKFVFKNKLINKLRIVCLLAMDQQSAGFDLPLCCFDLFTVSKQPSQMYHSFRQGYCSCAPQLHTLNWLITWLTAKNGMN